MANWLARMFTIPHHQRDEINKLLIENPAMLSVVNGLKDSLAHAAVSAAVGSNADPLESALLGMAIGQQIERMIPTPPAPDVNATLPLRPMPGPTTPVPTEAAGDPHA